LDERKNSNRMMKRIEEDAMEMERAKGVRE
jgi:hypothetical protein